MRGRPFSRLREHKLTCGWCEGVQNLELVSKLFWGKQKVAYRCDHCFRGLIIQKSAGGFYSAYQADRARYLKNVQKGVNRI